MIPRKRLKLPSFHHGLPRCSVLVLCSWARPLTRRPTWRRCLLPRHTGEGSGCCGLRFASVLRTAPAARPSHPSRQEVRHFGCPSRPKAPYRYQSLVPSAPARLDASSAFGEEHLGRFVGPILPAESNRQPERGGNQLQPPEKRGARARCQPGPGRTCRSRATEQGTDAPEAEVAAGPQGVVESCLSRRGPNSRSFFPPRADSPRRDPASGHWPKAAIDALPAREEDVPLSSHVEVCQNSFEALYPSVEEREAL